MTLVYIQHSHYKYVNIDRFCNVLDIQKHYFLITEDSMSSNSSSSDSDSSSEDQAKVQEVLLFHFLIRFNSMVFCS